MAAVAFSLRQPGILAAAAAHPFIMFLCTLAPLFAAQRFRNAFPANIGLVFLFTFVMGIAISPLIYVYGNAQPGIVGQAALLTGSTFGVLTLYAWVSRRDFSAWGSFFMIGVWVLIATSLLNLFFHSAIASLWIAGATVLVFSGLLVFDTWRLRNVFGPDDGGCDLPRPAEHVHGDSQPARRRPQKLIALRFGGHGVQPGSQ
jgi:FtsH-binding integral membrane protein